jgi:hypothetical protein
MRFPIEADALALVADDEPRALLERFAELTRVSGTADERAAADYIVSRLRAFGLEPRVYEPSLFLSIPHASSVRTVSPAGARGEYTSRPAAFSRSTGADEVTGDIAYVAGEFPVDANGLFSTPESALVAPPIDPVRGRIVLTEGFPVPGTVHAYERRGAIAQIYIQPGSAIHEFTCTTTWGTPTHESIAVRPRAPVVSVNRDAGEQLAAVAAAGGARTSVHAVLDEGWFTCPLVTVDIHGAIDPDEFLLVHGHYDSWYAGIGDNATGNAALLELARVLHRVRASLDRTVRIAWWPAALTGAHAGSAWYADTFADDIDQWCIAEMHVQSPGCSDADAYDEVAWMAEAAELCIDAIADAAGAAARGGRSPRSADSFTQIGVTGFFQRLSMIPAAERRARGDYAVGGSAGSPRWHTPEDDGSVADIAVLRRDLQVYLTTILRVVNAPLHPFDYTAAVLEIGAAVQRYQQAAGNAVNLRGASESLKRLRRELAVWRSDAETALRHNPRNHELRRRVNEAIRRLARILVPLGYVRGERFDHDPAVRLSAVPRLEGALHVAGVPSGMRPLLQAALVRERNKVQAAIGDALQLVRSSGSY